MSRIHAVVRKSSNSLIAGVVLAGCALLLNGCEQTPVPTNDGRGTELVSGAPSAPKGLQALAASPTEVLLDWQLPTTSVTHLSIERKGGANSDFVTIVEQHPGTQRDYLDIVLPETEYTYRVFAWEGDTKSAEAGGPVTLKTPPLPPDPPRRVDAKPVSQTQVNLSWGDAPRARTFAVLRGDKAYGDYSVVETLEGKQVYADKDLAPSTKYWYKIRALNDNPETTESLPVSATTPGESVAQQPAQATPEPPPPPQPEIPPLPQPVIVEAAAESAGRVFLRWEGPSRGALYTILRATRASGVYAPLDVVEAALFYRDDRVNPDREYWYKVRLLAPDGRSADSRAVLVRTLPPGIIVPPVVVVPPSIPIPPPPDRPTGVVVRNIAPDSIELRWEESRYADRYFILRSETRGDSFYLLDVVRGRPRYTDRDVLADTQYWYRIRAMNASKVAADSEMVSARTQAAPNPSPTPEPPRAPASVRARAVNPTEINIVWTDAENATRFMVLRAERRDGEYYPLERLEGKWSYTDRELEPNTTYWYKIRSLNSGAVYAESAPVSAKTLPAATPTVSPTPQPTETPTRTPRPTPGATPTPTPEVTPTPTPTPSPTPTPTETPRRTPRPTLSPTPEPTPTPTPEITPTPTPQPTPTPTPEVTPTPTPTPTATPAETPPRTPRPTPDRTPTPPPKATVWPTRQVKIGRTPEYTPRRPLLRPDPRETPVPAPDAKKVEEPSATPEVTGSNKPEPEASSSSPVLRVEGSGPEGVRLAWTASPGVRRFALLRSDSKDGEYKLVRAGEGAFAYVDRTAEAGKTYWYKIRTIGRSADESDSEPVSATVEQSADTPRERFRRR